MDPRDPQLDNQTATGDSASVVRHEEEVRTAVERVATERVVVRRRIVEEERTITVPVRREVVEIVREPITEGSPVGDDAFRRDAEDDTIEVLVRAEEPVVSTEVRVVERVVLQRTRVSEVVQVDVEVAREEVEVEQTGTGRGDLR